MSLTTFGKTLRLSLIAASLAVVSGSVLADDPVVVDAPVTFTGAVVDNTCDTPVVNGNADVDFGDVSKASFTGNGSVGREKTFQVALNNCGADASTVTVWLTAANADDTVHGLSNTVADGADNVAVQIYADGTQLEANNEDTAVDFTLTAEANNTLDFVGKLVQTGADAPTVGELAAAGTLKIQYN